MAFSTFEFLMLWLEMMNLHDHPANVVLAEKASELNDRCLGEVPYEQALSSIEQQDEPEVALRQSLTAFIRVETLFNHIKRVLQQALASCRIIIRETDLEGKSMLFLLIKLILRTDSSVCTTKNIPYFCTSRLPL